MAVTSTFDLPVTGFRLLYTDGTGADSAFNGQIAARLGDDRVLVFGARSGFTGDAYKLAMDAWTLDRASGDLTNLGARVLYTPNGQFVDNSSDAAKGAWGWGNEHALAVYDTRDGNSQAILVHWPTGGVPTVVDRVVLYDNTEQSFVPTDWSSTVRAGGGLVFVARWLGQLEVWTIDRSGDTLSVVRTQYATGSVTAHVAPSVTCADIGGVEHLLVMYGESGTSLLRLLALAWNGSAFTFVGPSVAGHALDYGSVYPGLANPSFLDWEGTGYGGSMVAALDDALLVGMGVVRGYDGSAFQYNLMTVRATFGGASSDDVTASSVAASGLAGTWTVGPPQLRRVPSRNYAVGAAVRQATGDNDNLAVVKFTADGVDADLASLETPADFASIQFDQSLLTTPPGPGVTAKAPYLLRTSSLTRWVTIDTLDADAVETVLTGRVRGQSATFQAA